MYELQTLAQHYEYNNSKNTQHKLMVLQLKQLEIGQMYADRR